MHASDRLADFQETLKHAHVGIRARGEVLKLVRRRFYCLLADAWAACVVCPDEMLLVPHQGAVAAHGLDRAGQRTRTWTRVIVGRVWRREPLRDTGRCRGRARVLLRERVRDALEIIEPQHLAGEQRDELLPIGRTRERHHSAAASRQACNGVRRGAARSGGYSRMLKTYPRIGDSSPMAFVEMVGREPKRMPWPLVEQPTSVYPGRGGRKWRAHRRDLRDEVR